MKQLLKAALPRSFISQAVGIKDRAQLGALPSMAFDPSHLRAAGDVSLDTWLNDQDIAEAWQKDSPPITNIYGDDDRYGGVNPGDRRALYYLVMALQPQNILEVGTHIGASTLYMASALKRSGAKGKITSVDITDVNDVETGAWKHVGMNKSPDGFACELDCRDHIDFQTRTSLQFMTKTDERYDLIFLDGDHRAPAVYQEISAALPLLNDGGVILLHDYYPEAQPLYPDNTVISGPFLALERARKENPSIGSIPLGALPWPTKQGSNYTSLALMARVDG